MIGMVRIGRVITIRDPGEIEVDSLIVILDHLIRGSTLMKHRLLHVIHVGSFTQESLVIKLLEHVFLVVRWSIRLVIAQRMVGKGSESAIHVLFVSF